MKGKGSETSYRGEGEGKREARRKSTMVFQDKSGKRGIFEESLQGV